jgi:hypothetical protein
MTITRRAVLAASVVSLGLSTTIMAGLQDSEPPRVIGRWDMAVVASGTTYPSWLEVQRSGTRTLVGRFVGSGGSARPISKIDFADNVLRFSIPPQWEQGDDDLRLEGTLDGDRLSGWMTDPAGKRLIWTASRRSFDASRRPRPCRVSQYHPDASEMSHQTDSPASPPERRDQGRAVR